MSSDINNPLLIWPLKGYRIRCLFYVTKNCQYGFRLANIVFQGKIPWITYKGQPMGDSGLIMEFLNEEFGVDLDSPLSDKERAISRAFIKMLEENTYWYGK